MKPSVILLGMCGIACGGESTSPGVWPEGEGLGSERPAEPLRDAPSTSPSASSPVATEPSLSAGPPNAPLPGAGAPSEGVPPEIPVAPPMSGTPAEAEQPSNPASSEPSESTPPVESAAPAVTVSFTFDDTYGPQVEAAAILDAHGVRGTFYVNSPELHRASANPSGNGPMTIAEVLEMQARGHDIGGHTLGHLSLTDVPDAERVREVVGDRAELMRLGIEARSFAYPYGHVEDDDPSLGRPVLEIARESGYTSARDTNGFELGDCARGPESLPPADAFIVRSIRSVNEPPEGAEQRIPADTAETLLGWIDEAARCGGGWLPLVFHHMRADCSDAAAPISYCFDLDELDRLAAALASGTRCPPGSAGGCYRVQVSTVSEAIGVSALAPARQVSGLRNPSLERTLDSGVTECIRRTGAGAGAAFERSALARSGQASERLEIAAPFQAAAEIGVERDFGECSVFAQEGRAYELSLHYRADVADDAPSLRFVTYRLTSAYEWQAWESGVAFAARSPGEWVRASFTTDAVPSDTIAISFGLRQESPGAINVDDFDSVALD